MPLETSDPHDHCHLSFPKVGRPGTKVEGHFFLLQVLENIVHLKVQPADSIPPSFDINEYDVRFQMQVIPRTPMPAAMARESLEIIYGIVFESEVREFTALVVCQGVVMGRFRTWLLDIADGGGALR